MDFLQHVVHIQTNLTKWLVCLFNKPCCQYWCFRSWRVLRLCSTCSRRRQQHLAPTRHQGPLVADPSTATGNTWFMPLQMFPVLWRHLPNSNVIAIEAASHRLGWDRNWDMHVMLYIF